MQPKKKFGFKGNKKKQSSIQALSEVVKPELQKENTFLTEGTLLTTTKITVYHALFLMARSEILKVLFYLLQLQNDSILNEFNLYQFVLRMNKSDFLIFDN